MPTIKKTQPLSPLFGSPRDLLDKAKRDLERLNDATVKGDVIAGRDALIDACAALYHLLDWMTVLCPGYNVAARDHANASKWIMLCKDICLAGKHFSLDPSHDTYALNAPTADYVDATATVPATGALLGSGTLGYPGAGCMGAGPLGMRQVLKVHSTTHGDHYAASVVEKAIADWESFFAGRKIP